MPVQVGAVFSVKSASDLKFKERLLSDVQPCSAATQPGLEGVGAPWPPKSAAGSAVDGFCCIRSVT